VDRVALECFVALAEELHFHRAADRCHISQPAMSQQIRRLEQELDVRLAHRTKRVVSLTRAGEVFLAEARKTIRQMDQSAELARRTDRGQIGQLTVGVTAPALFVVLPEVVAQFRRALPGPHSPPRAPRCAPLLAGSRRDRAPRGCSSTARSSR